MARRSSTPTVTATMTMMTSNKSVCWAEPEWPAPPQVRSLITRRHGGVSQSPYDSANLALHVGDDSRAVAENRRRLAAVLPSEPTWLEQVHGCDVVEIDNADFKKQVPRADAAVARIPGNVCAVMTADCLPVLLCDRGGQVVAVAHAGWRGLCNGVIEATVARMAAPAGALLAYLGPAIGPDAFEVGDEVRAAFLAHDRAAESCFRAYGTGKWLADLFSLACQRLAASGVKAVFGGGVCTYSDAENYFSYRRDGPSSGRMASLIWLAETPV